MGARMVPANGQTTKTTKILLFWLERLSILLQIYIRVQFLFSTKLQKKISKAPVS